MPVDRTTAYGPNLELDIADRLLEIYSNTERQLAADIARRLRAGMEAPDWAQQKLAQAGALRTATMALLSRLAVDDGTIAQALVLAYMRGGQAAAEELLRLGQQVSATGTEGALQGVLDASGAGVQQALASAVRAFPGLGALQRMVWSLASRLAGTHLPVLRWAIDSYREVVAEGALAPVLLGTATRRAGTQRAWERLLSQGVTGFTDVAGRRWNLASYVEMATRTGVAQAAVEGHLDRLAAAKLDLVIVSNAPQECVRCRPWEGKVLARVGEPGPRTAEMRHAITGVPVQVEVAGTVAEAIAAGLMHPNCRHSLSAYLPGVTRIPTNTEDPEGDEARQKLRALERNVRKAKLQQAGALTPEAAKRAEDQIRAGQAAIREHVKATKHLGIMRKPERERINLGHTTAAEAGQQRAKMPAAPKAPKAPKAKPATPPPAKPPAAPATPSNPAVLTGRPAVWQDALVEDTGFDKPVPVKDFELSGAGGYVVTSGSAYRVAGVTYLVEDRTLNPQLVAIEFAHVHGKLPDGATEYQRGYAWLAGRNPADTYWAEKYNMPGFSSLATAGDGSVRFWNQQGRPFGPESHAAEIAHEFGHNVSSGARKRDLHDGSQAWVDAVAGDFNRTEPDDWQPAPIVANSRSAISWGIQGDRPYPLGVTNYGTSSVAEDYAESMSMYLAQRIGTGRLTPGGPIVDIYFRDIFPERAKVLDLLFPAIAARQKAAVRGRTA